MMNKLEALRMLLSKLLEDSLLYVTCVLNNEVAKLEIRNNTYDSTGCRGIAMEAEFNATRLTERCGTSTRQGRHLPDELLQYYG